MSAREAALEVAGLHDVLNTRPRRNTLVIAQDLHRHIDKLPCLHERRCGRLEKEVL